MIHRFTKVVEDYLETKGIIERAKKQRGAFSENVVQKVIKEYQVKLREHSRKAMPCIQELVQLHYQCDNAIERLKTIKPNKDAIQELELLRKINAISQESYEKQIATLYGSFDSNKLVLLYQQIEKIERVLLWWADVSGETIPLEMRNNSFGNF